MGTTYPHRIENGNGEVLIFERVVTTPQVSGWSYGTRCSRAPGRSCTSTPSRTKA